MSHGPAFARRYGAHPSSVDLLRQIGHDELMHQEESERSPAGSTLR